MYLLDLERKHHPCVLPFSRVILVESPVSSAVVMCVEIRAVVLCVEEHARAGRRVCTVARERDLFVRTVVIYWGYVTCLISKGSTTLAFSHFLG